MRWIIRSLFVLFLLAFVALGSLSLIPSDRIAGLVVGQFKTITGRDLVIDGSVRPSVWPVLGVRTGKVSISNADWSDMGPMFQAEGLEIAVDMASLFSDAPRITAVAAVEPVLVLERAKDGRENWVFGGENGGSISTATPGVGTSYTLEKAVISGGRLVFLDHKAGTRLDLSDMAVTTAIPDFAGEVRVDLAAVKDGQAFALDLTFGAFRSFLDGKLGPVTAEFSAGKAQGTFTGQAGWKPMAAKGDLVADLGTLADVAALAGAAAPDLPAGFGAGGVSVKGAVTLTDAGSVHLRGGTVTLDSTVLAMDADLTQGEARPKLVAKVVAGALDLGAAVGGSGAGAKGGSGGGAQAAGWSKDAIDVSALGALDAEVALTADSLDLGVARLGAASVKLGLERSRAVFDIAQARAYGGRVAGQFVLNGRKSLSVGGDLTFSGMDMQALLRDFAGYERLVGTGDFRVKFLGSGGSVDAIMQGLEGDGSVALGHGEILGLDIGGMLRTLDTGFVGEGKKTIFDSLTGSFAIADGVLQNDDLLMAASFATVKGQGKLGLGARNINYRLRAEAAVGDKTLTAPILIKGPWADPKISLDLEALAKEQLEDEAKALEAAAKAKAAELEAEARARADALEAEARAKLEQELGIVQGEGESLEDAARRRGEEVLTNEAEKALRKLLGQD